MFKQVQWKFFAITTSLVLAVLIAALASINLIMKAVMQHQSQVVLKQIAASVEYDDTTSTFTYFPEFEEGNKPPEIPEDNHGDRPMGSPADKIEDITSPDSNSSAPTEGNTDTPTTGSNTHSTDPPAPTDTDIPPTERPQTPTTGSEENTTASVTTAVEDRPITQTGTETITPPVTDMPPGMRPEPPVTTTNPNQNIPPEYIYPTYPQRPEWDDDPKEPWEEYQPPTDENGYPVLPPYHMDYDDDDYDFDDDDYYCSYPEPDCRYDEWFNREYSCVDTTKEYEERTTEAFGYDEADDSDNDDEEDDNYSADNDTDDGEFTLLADGNVPVLNGFTVSDSPKKQLLLADNAVQPLKNEPIPKTLGSIDFFILMADKSGNFIASLNNEVLSTDTAQKYVSAIMNEGAVNGMLNSYQFCSSEKGNGTIMVLTDKSSELDMLDNLSRTSVLIGIIAFIVLSVIAFFLSKKSIEPVKVAFEKQKQFISDASHELKTPLTIISANADVLSEEIGTNKWLTYIQAQADRMNVLVNDLLNLTRLENNTGDFIKCDFDLSKAVENTVLPFECRAFEENRKLEIDIQDGLTVNGSERHIKQMAAIFIDNALKYSDENGTVKVSLSRVGDKNVFSVFNTGTGIKETEKDKIFERFYRSDDSRSRMTGGYGLGLPIAKSIIDKHKFKVSIDNHEGHSICFNVTM